MSKTQIAVIGSGIVGLTTALEIQEVGYAVTIYAAAFPGDEKSSHYTSPWAGAHHVSAPGIDPQKFAFERETFRRLWELSAENSEEARCFMRTPQREYYTEDMTGKTNLEHMPDFRVLSQDELVHHAVYGVAFTTVNIETPIYLPFLLARFLARGGRVCRVHVQHIDQVLLGAWGMPVPDGLVICAGIGARSLGGVEDRDVYPIRGQTILIRAPWVREGRTLRVQDDFTYILARPSGDVLLGGTLDVDDWYPHPRASTGREIMRRAMELMPELVPSGKLEDAEKLVIEHGCGLRPGRKGGIRLELGVVEAKRGKAVPIVYNYGHGGGGYQGSWGTAGAAKEMLKKGLEEM